MDHFLHLQSVSHEHACMFHMLYHCNLALPPHCHHRFARHHSSLPVATVTIAGLRTIWLHIHVAIVQCHSMNG